MDYQEPLTLLEGGIETHLYRFRLKNAPQEFLKPLVLRLYPQFCGTRSVVVEQTVQNELAGKGLPVARVFLICTDTTILDGSFLIMAFLDGNLMLAAPFDAIPDLLAKSHAALHQLKPDRLIKSLYEQKIEDFRLAHNLNRLKDKAQRHPKLQVVVNWLQENRLEDKDQLVICHGDFHYLNILMAGKTVSAILDWSCFLIAHPLLDIANTMVIITMISRHLLPLAVEGFSFVDWEVFAQNYLDAYQTYNRLPDVNDLRYYMARRAVEAVLQALEGQTALRHPLILNDMPTFIGHATQIQIPISTITDEHLD